MSSLHKLKQILVSAAIQMFSNVIILLDCFASRGLQVFWFKNMFR